MVEIPWPTRLLVRPVISAGGLNTGKTYLVLGKMQIGCILHSGKIEADVFRFYGFWVNPRGLECLFSEIFLGQNQNFSMFIT